MSFANLYRASFYAMLICATLVLSVDATDNPLSMLYPVAVAAAAVVAFLTVDRDPARGLSALPLNLLALASFPMALAEYLVDRNLMVLALGHWLVYLQLILMFRPKSVSEEWELFLLGLVQVLVGTVISQSDTVGTMLFAWAVLALWVLGLFSLRREALRARAAVPSAPASAGSAAAESPVAIAAPRRGSAVVAGSEVYPGLLDAPFLVSALRLTVTTLALGGVIFLVMPRQPVMARARGGDAPGQHLSGFDEEVRLGQLGEILENDSVVMSVEMTDRDGNSVASQGEPLWRGVTLTSYESGRWTRERFRPGALPVFTTAAPAYRRLGTDPARVRQRIKLEPTDSNTLFGLRPILEASAGRRPDPEINESDGGVARGDSRPGPYDYEVTSLADDSAPQPGERAPNPERLAALGAVPEAIRDRLRAIAEGVIARDLPEGRRDDPGARARALTAYLRDSGRFGYTLKLDPIDRTIDPVVDFLENRKEGHCEYFASALTLLLRSVDIPARMVNGFKGGDYNDLARLLTVRQKHAHSWVEAYLGAGPSPDRTPIWLALDPTPGTARNQSVARVGGFRTNFLQVTDFVRYAWVFYVVGYNAERQDRLVYLPAKLLTREASRGFALMGQWAREAWARLLNLLRFRTAESLVSVRGLVVSFVALLLVVGSVRATAWALRRLTRWFGGRGEDDGPLTGGEAHYRRLARLLAGYGLERPPAETPDEFARRATVFLAARGSEAEAVADVPRLVVEAFYRVRFGALTLAPAALGRLDDRLDALQANLQEPPA